MRSGIRQQLYDEDGRKDIQCNIWDITECKKGEEALRRAHAQLADRAGQLEQAVAERTTAHRISTSARFMNALLQDSLAFSRLISRWSGEGDCLAPDPTTQVPIPTNRLTGPSMGPLAGTGAELQVAFAPFHAPGFAGLNLLLQVLCCL